MSIGSDVRKMLERKIVEFVCRTWKVKKEVVHYCKVYTMFLNNGY